jgi:Uma2 family endonuclease
LPISLSFRSAVPSRLSLLRLLAIVEVLSPEDRVSRYQSRLDDYRTMGVANIWVIDPMRRKAYDCSQVGWQAVDKLVIANSLIEIPLDPLWKKLEELHS